MEPNFWLERWARGQIGFHLSQANPLLVAHFEDLHLGQDSRIFLPLCGKTLDIAWLLTAGHRVVGAELSRQAIDELFHSLDVVPTITEQGDLLRYQAKNIDVYVGDIFRLSAAILGPVDAIYDRAALVAMPADRRQRYATHLIEITHGAPQLTVTYVYDQSLADGPPFSVPESELLQHYRHRYDITLLETLSVANGIRGLAPATESAWLLTPLPSREPDSRATSV